MNKIKWTAEEMEAIKIHGETCIAAAKAAMMRSGINFDDIEQINNHFEDHVWGSNADRAYRKRAVKKAVAIVAQNPLKYAAQ